MNTVEVKSGGGGGGGEGIFHPQLCKSQSIAREKKKKKKKNKKKKKKKKKKVKGVFHGAFHRHAVGAAGAGNGSCAQYTCVH